MRPELLAQLKRQEGFRSKVYPDTVGKLTIGFGHNLENNEISEDIGTLILKDDLERTEYEVFQYLPWLQNIDSVRQEVFINMAFQMGMAGLLKFDKTINYAHAGDYKSASEEMLKSIWAMQTPNRAKELSQQLESGMRSE